MVTSKIVNNHRGSGSVAEFRLVQTGRGLRGSLYMTTIFGGYGEGDWCREACETWGEALFCRLDYGVSRGRFLSAAPCAWRPDQGIFPSQQNLAGLQIAGLASNSVA